MIKVFSKKAEAPDTIPIDKVKFSDSPDVIAGYLSDESSTVKGQAEKVFFPTNEAEIASILRWANETGTPVTVSGGGTGITGSRAPLSGAVIATDKLIRAREIPRMADKKVGHLGITETISFYLDEEKSLVIVPPGILLSDFIAAISRKNLYYPPYPTEQSCTLGGNVSTNASGGRSFKYGAIRRWVGRLRIILPTGELLEVRRKEVFADEEGYFHIEYPDGTAKKVPIPSYNMPRVKNASGLYSKPEMDLIDLFIGCEGILGVFTEIELNLLKTDDELFSFIVFFPSEEKSIEFVKTARRKSRDPKESIDAVTLDYFDVFSLEFMRNTNTDIPKGAEAAVFIEQFIHGDPDPVMMGWMELFEEYGSIGDWSAMNDKDREKLKLFRHSLPENINETIRRRGVKKMGLDLAVPDDRLDDIIKIYREEGKASGVHYVLFGHIGDNNIHMNFLAKDAVELESLKAFYLSIARKGIAMGGTISAEHGVGKKQFTLEGRTFPYLELMYGEEGLRSIANIKKILDPKGILNRGNIIPESYL